ncbi:MAG: hypothetical protein ACOY4R_29610 [Pseudomonadota bacterium]
MTLPPGIREKLVLAGTARLAAALARRGQQPPPLAGLRPLSPHQEPFAGRAAVGIAACARGDVLVLSEAAKAIPLALLARRRIAGVVSAVPLRNAAELVRTGLPAWHLPAGAPSPSALPVTAGDVVVADRDGVLALPASLAGTLADEVEETLAYEEFVAEQVSAGGGVYGLHIPSGEQARRAFAEWRRLKGR